MTFNEPLFPISFNPSISGFSIIHEQCAWSTSTGYNVGFTRCKRSLPLWRSLAAAISFISYVPPIGIVYAASAILFSSLFYIGDDTVRNPDVLSCQLVILIANLFPTSNLFPVFPELFPKIKEKGGLAGFWLFFLTCIIHHDLLSICL